MAGRPDEGRGELSLEGRVKGCILAGAAGDALGAPVEFLDWVDIVDMLGPRGVTGMLPPGHFTDDTQMLLFTIEALLRASMELEATGSCHPPTLLHRSYLRWLATQGRNLDAIWPGDPAEAERGMLIADERLHRLEAPGTTCLTALESGDLGTMARPLNDSKGCGGVMRAAPAGLLVPGAAPGSAPAEAYQLGCEAAAVTHGHPLGYHSAGLLAALIHLVVAGASVEEAYRSCRALAPGDLVEICDRAVALGADGPPSPTAIKKTLNEGWVGEEALAIALACAVGAQSISEGVLAAVNHDGDTDSTGSICGNLLGAERGVEEIDPTWLEQLDAVDLVEAVAQDCATWVVDRPPADVPDGRFGRLFERYGA